MKTVFNKLVAKILFALLLLISSVSGFSQASPDYSFTNYSLDSGTDRQVGAVYRFTNVKANTDAFVKILSISSGLTINKLDRTADGYKEAFQPEIKVSGNKNGYVGFQISFVESGTNIRVNQTQITTSALDIDGDISGSGILYEYNKIDMGGGVVSFSTLSTQITVLPVGTGFQATNITGTLFGASVDTSALDVMFTVKNGGINTFVWRTGVNNLLNNATSTRYTSLYFKDFNYGGLVLSVSKILDFTGHSNNNTVSLNWKMEAEAGYTCQLERAGDNNQFETIEGFYGDENDNYTYSGSMNLSGRSLYRVKLVGPNDQVKYSNVISFQKGTGSNELKVYPSIVTSKQFTVNIAASAAQQGSVQVVDYAGRVVYKKSMTLNTGTNSITVNDFNSSLRGNYVVVANTGTEQYSSKIIIQ